MPLLDLGAFTGLGRRPMEDLSAPPRETERLHGALVLDLLHSFEEAERVLTVAELGAHELLGVLQREAVRLGITTTDTAVEQVDLTDEEITALAPFYARQEMARVSIQREHPEIRAFTLIAMYSALDSFVEGVVLSFLSHAQELRGESVSPATTTPAIVQQARREVAEAIEAGRLTQETAEVLTSRLKVLQAGPRGLGLARYEKPLRLLGLGNRDRDVPDDLDEALRNFGAIRNCMTHRRGRGDTRLFSDAPRLREKYSLGKVIRLTRSDYRTYSAALWTMAEDAQARIAMFAGADPKDYPLSGWRGKCTINS